MSCISLAEIQNVLGRLRASISSTTRDKRLKYEDFKCATRVLSRYSVDQRGGYCCFLGLQDNDPTKFSVCYLDNLRGEHDVTYRINFAQYCDVGGVMRDVCGDQPVCDIKRSRSGNHDKRRRIN